MIDILLHTALIIIQNYMIIKFINTYFDNHKNKKATLFIITLLSLESIVLTYSSIYMMFIMLIPIITCIIYSYIIHHKDVFKTMYVVLLCFAIMYTINYTTMTLLHSMEIEYNNLSNGSQFIITFIVQILYAIMLQLFSYTKKNSYNLDTFTWVKLISIPLSLILIIEISFYYITYISGAYIASLIIIILCFFINFIAFQQLSELHAYKDKMQEYEIRALTKEYEKMRLEDLKKMYDKNNKLRHDFNNHLTVLKKMINNSLKEESNRYLNDVLERIEGKHYIQTNNLTLDYIVNSKLIQYDGIFKFNYSGDINFLTEFEIVTLFGNLIDNALEAQKNIEQKYISIGISQQEHFTTISVSNKMDNDQIIMENGMPKTTKKKNKKEHGIGLINIKNTISKYSGELYFQTIDNYFTIKCLIVTTDGMF